MIFFLHVPHKNALIHSRRYYKPRVWCPTQVQNILSMTHQTALRRPSHYALWSVNRETVFSTLPNGDAFVIRPRGKKPTVGRVSNNIGVFVGLVQSIENSNVFLVRVDRLPIVDDLPELNAPLSALTLLLHKSLLIRARTHELILEGVKVDRQNAILGAVPPHLRWLHSHKLAVSLYYSSKSHRTLNTELFLHDYKKLKDFSLRSYSHVEKSCLVIFGFCLSCFFWMFLLSYVEKQKS